MKSILTLSFFMAFQMAVAGDPKYPVSDIPQELKEGVNAVVRENRTVFKILSKAKATYYVFEAITILNEKGNAHAEQVLGYDKLSKIKVFNGSVFDASGKLIRKMKSSDIHDQSSYDGFSLYSDNRTKWVDLAQATYPYTVEFEYEIESRFLYSIPGFYVIPGKAISVQRSSYTLQFPDDLTPRFRMFNIQQEPQNEKAQDGLKSLRWEFENIKPVKYESMSNNEFIPRILVAPSIFEYDGYAGNMSNWEDFGKWSLTLNNGRDVLPELTKQKVRELTKGLTTTEQKVKVLYNFLQNKTRYVSIQEGIGGLQPFPANVVDETGYGDCKALSNYMVALLKEAGVKGYYTRIRAGDDEKDMITDFPSPQSNHVIVAVPNEKDTLWLECTSQTNPFGYQGTFTGNRKALMVTENGGKIVNTLRYAEDKNRQIRSANVFVDKMGNAKAKVKTTYSGLQYENDGLEFILDNQYDAQKKWVQNNTEIPSFDITAMSMTNKKDKIPSAIVNLELTLNRLATVSGKRLFLTPNLMNRSTFVPEKVEERKTPILIRMAYTDLDTIRYHLPEEIYPEFLPEPVKISSRFGDYETTFKLDQGNVVYIRKMVMRKGEYPPETYKELTDFYKSINKADNMKLVFLNKT